MGVPEFIALAKDQGAVMGEHPLLFFAFAALVAGFVWWLRGIIDSSQADGLKAQLEARNERLSLAEEKQKSATDRLEREVGELRMQIATSAPSSVLAATSSSIETAVTALSTANTELHEAIKPAHFPRYYGVFRYRDDDEGS
jgi:hypothetical protein